MYSFGVFGDLHYAGDVKYADRCCGFSLEKLKVCLEIFKSRNVGFILNLGDLVDTSGSYERDRADLSEIMRVISGHGLTVYNVTGNHDLVSMSKKEFCCTVNPYIRKAYYSFDNDIFHFIVLDANFSSDGMEYCRNDFDWKDSIIPDEQLDWLASDLDKCGQETVIIGIHQNLDDKGPADQDRQHMVKNSDRVKKIIKGCDKKVLVLQGHFHPGYYQNIDGIDFLTIRAMCEGEGYENNSFGIIHVSSDAKIRFEGFYMQPDVLLREIRA